MSLETYTSQTQRIAHRDADIYRVLSNPKALQPLLSQVPENEYISEVRADNDSLIFVTKQMGEVALRIVDREENKTIKMEAANSPVAANMWFQLKSVADNDTAMRVTIKAELPFMIKMMLGDRVQQGLDRMAQMLAMLPFDKLTEFTI